ncbi:zinc finger protein hunchback isoform 1-T5 [Glossina fuscipes fuscipes]
MQNWGEAMPNAANYMEHNTWYNNMFAANIKTEPDTLSPSSGGNNNNNNNNNNINTHNNNHQGNTNHLETYLKHQIQQQQQQATSLDTLNTMTLSPHNHSEQFFDGSLPQQQQHQLLQQQHYQQHFHQAQQAAAQNLAAASSSSHVLQLGFNPLTPPGYPNAVIPPNISQFYSQRPLSNRSHQQTPSPGPISASTSSSHMEQSEKSVLTPRHTPPMDITPPKSPKSLSSLVEVQISEKEELMSNSSEDLRANVGLTFVESLKLRRYKHGKLKMYECKTCHHLSATKWEEYEHRRTHEDIEKVFQCPKCPFVARVKHHLDKFHLIKHENVKPYKCEECDYSCENVSMLTSHQKKHSPVYPYQCGECRYAAKFCNPFKKHLRNTKHKVYKILDENGVPIPSKFLDVYGSKRGPKNNSSSRSRGSLRRANKGELKLPNSPKLSASLQGYSINPSQMPTSPTKSNSSLNSNHNSTNEEPGPQLLPNLDTFLQLEYFKLLAQRQANALVHQQHSPSLGEQREPLTPPEEDEMEQEEDDDDDDDDEDDEEDDDDDGDKEHEEQEVEDGNKTEKTDDDENDDKAAETLEMKQNRNSAKLDEAAIDLSQSNAPHKIAEGDMSRGQTPEVGHILKLPIEIEETPLYPCSGAAKRKGRVLRLEQEQIMTNLSSTKEEHMEVEHNDVLTTTTNVASSASLPSSSTPSPLSVTSSNQSRSDVSNSIVSTSSVAALLANISSTFKTDNESAVASENHVYECKYCETSFKDSVLHTIHMGFHSRDDPFKCNLCGEKCDGAVALTVHLTRKEHS